jgi:RimJ/RimL family protein N-acetyltransferase
MMKKLETERLIIRNYHENDWQDMYEYFSDAKVLEFEPYLPFSEEECKVTCKKRAEGENFYAVCLKETNKMIGNLYVSLGDEKFNTWEIGYVFNSKYQGKGYASESAKAMIQYLFSEKNARRIIAMCDPLNVPSWKLLERVGMQREAHFRKEVYFKCDENGQPIWKDTYVYGILESDLLDK